MSATVLLGDASVEPQYDSLSPGQAEAFELRAAATGVARLAHVYLGVANAASTVVVGLYSSVYGHPGVLLSTGTASASPGGTWTTVPLASIEVLAGKIYWLAILGTRGTLRYRDRARGQCPSQTSAQTTLGALPEYWKTGVGYSDCPPSAYVTVGPSAPPSQPLEPVAPAPPLEPPAQEPTAPAAPGSVVPPGISGSAAEGQELSAAAGSWSGSPTSYAYQWKDCNAAGEACSSISGATSVSYRLLAGDVGHTVRVVVSASNAGGSTPASSPPTAVVSAVPVAELMLGSSSLQPDDDSSAAGSAEAFQVTAAATGTVHSFSLYVGSATTAKSILVGLYSSNSGSPGTLLTGATIVSPVPGAWNAAGVTTPVSVKSGSVYWLAALAPAGTLAIRDVASGGGPTQGSASRSLGALPYSWSSGESWANSPASFYASGAIVEAEAAPPPSAPVSSAAPAISGTAVEGQTLSAGTGTWSGSPTSYAYQWERCNTAGEGCSSIAGASVASYLLSASDTAHTLRVVVTATNAGGSAAATSAPSAAVAQAGSEGTKTVSPNLSARNCFANPETEGTSKIEECGYAGENNTGPEPGTCCTVETGNKTLGPGAKLEGREVRGNITISGSNVSLKNDRIIGKAGCTGTEKGWTVCGGEHPAVKIEAENATIEHTLVEGESAKGAGLVTECIDSYTHTTTVRYSHWTNCDGAKFDGGGTIEKDFCVDNAEFLYEKGQPEHYECTNDDCKPGLLIEKENTFFNVHEQTAAIFTQGTTDPCSEQRIERNFLAGGGWVYYGENSGSFTGLGPEYFLDNRVAFATCANGKEKETKASEGEFVGEGHVVCQEQSAWSGHMVQWTPQTPGGTGYFPQGGSYNGVCLDLVKNAHDEGNFRDNNGAGVC